MNLPRKALLTIYRSIIRPHLDHGDILYDKPNNVNFQDKIEKVRYRACLAITGAIQGTSKEKIYDELGLHSLTKRRWHSKLIFFNKIVNGLLPNYLYSYLHFSSEEIYPLRLAASSKLRPFSSRTKSFKNTFFPYCVNEWNNLKADIRNAKSLNIIKKLVISEKKKENPLFSAYDPLGVKFLTRLRLDFSHLNEHKFRNGFKDTLNPLYTCGVEVETTEPFLLHCQLYSIHRPELFDKIVKIDQHFLNLTAKNQVLVLLYD